MLRQVEQEDFWYFIFHTLPRNSELRKTNARKHDVMRMIE